MNIFRKIKITKRILIASIIPIISFFVSVFAIYKYNDDLGPIIHIEFSSAEGIEEGKTLLKYHGIPVGKVEKLVVSKDLRKVDFQVRLVKNASHIANYGAKFWIVKPRADLSGLENLETIVSGEYIAVELPKKIYKTTLGFNQCHFIGLEKKIRKIDAEEEDFIVKVKTPHVLSSVMIGSPVLYKGFIVGIIDDIELPKHGKNILLTINIKENYAHLLRTNTIFWNLQTLDLKWQLFKGLKLHINSNPIKNFLQGGIGFSTPPYAGCKVNPGHTYSLVNNFEEEWLNWEPNID